MLWLLAALLAIPLGLDLDLPVPEDNPLTAEKIELGRRLFHDRREQALVAFLKGLSGTIREGVRRASSKR